MKAQEAYVTVANDGTVANARWFLDWFKSAIAKHHGKDIRVSIERKRKTRTSSQNRFFHGVFLESYMQMHNFFGTFDFEIDLDDAKEVIKQELFWPKRGDIPMPSRKLDTQQIETVMESARVKYAEHWQLPYPNEENYELRS